MSEYEQGVNILVRLPAELQRIVKQKLSEGMWVVMKTHRPCELLDDRPFYWSCDYSWGKHVNFRYNRSRQDRERLLDMSPEMYSTEIVPPGVYWR